MTLSLLHRRHSLHLIVATTPPILKRRAVLLLVCLPWVLILPLWSMNGLYVCRCFLAEHDVGSSLQQKESAVVKRNERKKQK